MNIINDITRVAMESKRIIRWQQEEIEKLRMENEAYKSALSNQDNIQTVKGSGIGKYFDDGILTVEVTGLYPFRSNESIIMATLMEMISVTSVTMKGCGPTNIWTVSLIWQ